MNVGLLWYDADPKKAALAKIDEAAARYRERFDISPDTCHVNPSQVTTHPNLRIVGDRWVRPGYFWIGIDEDLPSIPQATPRPEQHSSGGYRAPREIAPAVRTA